MCFICDAISCLHSATYAMHSLANNARARVTFNETLWAATIYVQENFSRIVSRSRCHVPLHCCENQLDESGNGEGENARMWPVGSRKFRNKSAAQPKLSDLIRLRVMFVGQIPQSSRSPSHVKRRKILSRCNLFSFQAKKAKNIFFAHQRRAFALLKSLKAFDPNDRN